MFVFGNLFLYLLLLVLCDQSLRTVSEDLMLELYSKYISAVSNDNFKEATRRLLKRNREFEIHVSKLKEVNGFKKHNLFVKESLRSGGKESFIYINNPVESKTAKSYLTLEEFKIALSDRVLEQKKELTLQRRKKEITLSYSNIFSSHTYNTRTLGTRHKTKNQRIVNIPGKKSNTDTITLKSNTYNEKVNINESKINNNKVLDRDKTKISTKKVSATINNVHKKNVTNTEKVSETNTILYLFTNITEGYTNIETEIGNQDINLDTTETETKNTATEQTMSDTQSINFVETELLTDTTDTVNTSTVFEFKTTNTEILTNIENITNESFKMAEEPRRKKRTKSFSVPTKKKRVPLGVSFHIILDIKKVIVHSRG